MNRLAFLVAAAAIVVGLAGCGGQKVYTLDRSKACLQQRAVRIGGPLSFVANTATGGAFRANLPGNFVQVAFGDTQGSGIDIENAYQRFALPNVRPGLPDVLRRYNNAVTLWHVHPSDSDLALIVGCLR
jgi:hypothetical protein